MPDSSGNFNAGDAKRHKKGLSSSQTKKWATIATNVFKTCLDAGKNAKDCEGMAIRVANSKV